MKSLKGKVIVITGSASGIGAKTAHQLARVGADLVLADINVDGLHEKLAELSSHAPHAIAVPTDVSRRESWENLLARSAAEFGHVEVLINCAGVIHPGAVDELSEAALRRQVEVNFLGTVYGTQVFLPYFRQRQRGHFIHIASLGGIVPLPGEAVYSATKFAVRGFCLALALELQNTPIKVSVVCPDSVETPQLRAEALHGGSSLSFTGSLLQPADVAQAIVKTILHPKREVLVPAFRGWLTKLGNFSPNLMALLYPLLDKIGRRGLEKFQRTMIQNRKMVFDNMPDRKT
jgi:3-oxoacyl-[acyl-carrier protein] reductase